MCDSDSNDDDDKDLLELEVFAKTTKRKRTDEKRIRKGFDLMDEAIGHADRIAENHNRILQIKQEHCGDAISNEEDDDNERLEESLARTEHTVATAKANNTAEHEQRDFIEGSFPDDENVLTRERRMQLGRCMFSEINSGLGLRRTILTSGVRHKNIDSTTAYFSTDGSLQTHRKDLTTMLSRIVSPNNKPLQLAWIQPLRNAKKTTQALTLFLRTHQLAKLRQAHELYIIPEEILQWIFGVACSSSSNNDDAKTSSLLPPLRYASLSALLGLLKQHQQIVARLQENDSDASHIQELAFLRLSQMQIQLQSWVQFASSTTAIEGVGGIERETVADDDAMDDNAQGVTNDGSAAECRARGLQRWLDIWNKAFRYDLVTSRDEEDWKGAATRALVLLAKVGLDRYTFSSQRACRLLDPLQKVTSAVIKYVEKQFETKGAGTDDAMDHDHERSINQQQLTLHDWMRHTAGAIVEEIKASDMGSGAAEAEDDDDPEAWLCFALVGRVFPIDNKDTKGTTSTVVAEFKVFVCMELLRHVCGVLKPWQIHISEVLSEKCKHLHDNYPTDFVERTESSLRWRALSSCWVALLELEGRFGGKLSQNGPRCYAILILALESCMFAALALFRGFHVEKTEAVTEPTDATGPTVPVAPPQNNEDVKDQRPNEFKTKEEARNVARLLELLRDQCQTIERNLMGLGRGKAHFRRMCSILQWQSKYCGEFRGKTARQAGERDLVQNNLEAWIKMERDNGKKVYDDGEHDEDEEESDAENNTPEQGA